MVVDPACHRALHNSLNFGHKTTSTRRCDFPNDSLEIELDTAVRCEWPACPHAVIDKPVHSHSAASHRSCVCVRRARFWPAKLPARRGLLMMAVRSRDRLCPKDGGSANAIRTSPFRHPSSRSRNSMLLVFPNCCWKYVTTSFLLRASTTGFWLQYF